MKVKRENIIKKLANKLYEVNENLDYINESFEQRNRRRMMQFAEIFIESMENLIEIKKEE